MSETYVECLVARKSSMLMTFLKFFLIMMAVVLLLFGVGTGYVAALILGIVAGVGAYFATMNADIEYEYLYVDKEISVDKVLAKSKRKKAGTYSVEQMEIFAPLNSHRLDSYRNRDTKTVDYSSGIESQPERRYMMVCNGGIRVILEPNEALIKAVQTVAPRKVFTD
ncbi:MAG: hypothetical protein J1F18_00800 [Lachnospiraceae bacterium]|nr:hypothetical protein [Lachnospiraceae bacterium]